MLQRAQHRDHLAPDLAVAAAMDEAGNAAHLRCPSS
jgi:hypothetical protein